MLTVESVRAGYGRVPVLHGVTMEVAAQEIVAIVGRNGMGKTTLLKTIAGVVRTSGGSIRMDGRDVTKAPAYKRARRGMAYVPQGRDIFPELSVLENLQVAAYSHRRTDWRSNVDRVLDEFPTLADKVRQAGGGLSGGQQQLLAFARALVTEPTVLLLDEPSEGIQPSLVDAIGDVILAVNRSRAMTIVLVEQNLNFAAQVASRAFVMTKGLIETELPMKTLAERRDLQHAFLGV